jgi:hypothetical protein
LTEAFTGTAFFTIPVPPGSRSAHRVTAGGIDEKEFDPLSSSGTWVKSEYEIPVGSVKVER